MIEGITSFFSRDVVDSNWNILKDNDIDIYASNVTNRIIELARKHVPNKNIKVRKSDPPWLNNNIQKLMRRKKRLFDKYKRTNNLNDFERYKQVRNKVTGEIRKSKKLQLDKLSYPNLDLRKKLMNAVSVMCEQTLNVLLYGNTVYTNRIRKYF